MGKEEPKGLGKSSLAERWRTGRENSRKRHNIRKSGVGHLDLPGGLLSSSLSFNKPNYAEITQAATTAARAQQREFKINVQQKRAVGQNVRAKLNFVQSEQKANNWVSLVIFSPYPSAFYQHKFITLLCSIAYSCQSQQPTRQMSVIQHQDIHLYN